VSSKRKGSTALSKIALIVEDSPTLRREIMETLADVSLFFRFLEAGDGVEGLRLALDNPVDIILCDLVMPRMDGFRFTQLLRARKELHDVPIIMLTGEGDSEMKVRGLEIGANDYITKPFDRGELIARVKVHLKIKELQDELRNANRLLTELSNTDPLTSLYNRRFLFESFGKELQRAARKKGELAVLILDIDHFKKINDGYGHQQGDLVLARVAGTLLSHLRNYDIPARYGGEEFVVILPDSSLKDAMMVAERLRTAVSDMTFPLPMNGLKVTASFGVAAYSPSGANTVDALIREADAALYVAKSGGRNRVVAAPGG
jgi:two-component system, cell cycle response regulator